VCRSSLTNTTDKNIGRFIQSKKLPVYHATIEVPCSEIKSATFKAKDVIMCCLIRPIVYFGAVIGECRAMVES
jgi:hypothetical protein